MDMRSPPLKTKILLESNPPKPSEIQNLSTEIGRTPNPSLGIEPQTSC